VGTAHKPTPSVSQLDWDDVDGNVTVTPKDKDRYVVKVRTAIKRMKLGGDIEAIERKLALLQRVLGEWLAERTDIRQAYLTMRDGGFLFLVIKDKAEYDEEFEDSLSDLDIQIARDVDLAGLPLDVLALPCVSQQAADHFLDDTFSLRYAKAVE
jgi:hypothetical protein